MNPDVASPTSDTFVDMLRDAVTSGSSEGRALALEKTHKLCRKGEARDADWGLETHVALAEVVTFAWEVSSRARSKAEREAAATKLRLSNEMLLMCRQFPEVTTTARRDSAS